MQYYISRKFLFIHDKVKVEPKRDKEREIRFKHIEKYFTSICLHLHLA
jgi:hypothetical protein